MRRPMLAEVMSGIKDKCQQEAKNESGLIKPEDWRLRTSGIRHRKVKQRESRAIYKNKQGPAGLSATRSEVRRTRGE